MADEKGTISLDLRTKMQMAAVLDKTGTPEQKQEARAFVSDLIAGKPEHEAGIREHVTMDQGVVTKECTIDVFAVLAASMLNEMHQVPTTVDLIVYSPAGLEPPADSDDDYVVDYMEAIGYPTIPYAEGGTWVPQFKERVKTSSRSFLWVNRLNHEAVFEAVGKAAQPVYNDKLPLSIGLFTPIEAENFFVVTEIRADATEWNFVEVVKRRPEGMSEVEAHRILKPVKVKGTIDFITAARWLHRLFVIHATT